LFHKQEEGEVRRVALFGSGAAKAREHDWMAGARFEFAQLKYRWKVLLAEW